MISIANAATTAMRKVYWLAKEKIATIKYYCLLVLQNCLSMNDINVGRNAQYSSNHIAEEMQEGKLHKQQTTKQPLCDC